ncbi:MAG: hypothetical protein P1V51_24800 [Deltaproteobacteria bacterium]|nr:hypothetical protein [Deltaproteobacteria bacterium]
MRRLSLIVLSALALLGCPSGEGDSGGGGAASNKVSSAAKDFLSFAKTGDAAARGGPGMQHREVHYSVARNVLVPGERPVRRVELELPLQIGAGDLEATLRAASRRGDLGEEGALLELVAHPGKLRNLCGPYALFTVARDGKPVPRTEGLNERLLMEPKLGAELDLDETRAVIPMDDVAGTGAKRKAIVAAGVAAGLDEARAEKLLEKLEEHYPPPPKVK